MKTIRLVTSVGHEPLDALLRSTIGILETMFPDRIRAYYVTGSFAEDTAVATSDLDLAVVFKQQATEREREAVWDIGDYLSQVSHRFLDLVGVSEAIMLHEGHPLKANSLLLYGQDIRDQLPEMPFDSYLANSIHAASHFIVQVARQSQQIRFPLDFPDSHGEFYGYDYDPIEETRDTKVLTAIVAHIATAIIAAQAHQRVSSKRQCVLAYRQFIQDEWTDLVETVYETCRDQWQYRIPELAEERAQLRALCQAVLKFENHFLATYRHEAALARYFVSE